MLKIGFIGLGNMGLPMATNLLKAGHALTAFDLNKDACKKLEAQGARIAEKITDCAADADFLISMLPSGLIMRACVVLTFKVDRVAAGAKHTVTQLCFSETCRVIRSNDTNDKNGTCSRNCKLS